MQLSSMTRRVGLALVVAVVAACNAPASPASPSAAAPSAAAPSGAGASGAGASAAAVTPVKPTSPVTINILDVAGNLQLTQGMLDNFKKSNPDLVKEIITAKATAPELAGKLQAQQASGTATINMVLTGTDGLSAGIKNNLLLPIQSLYEADHKGFLDNYLDPAKNMQALAQGFGIEIVYYPSGPLVEYNPTAVTTPPSTPADLLAWAKAHPGRFEYARPANSGPGRTFLMALPYILGDSDPTDPTNGWSKTWDYLKQLGQYINQYPTGTTATMQDLGKGTVDMVMSTTGWDINPRVLGTVPNTVKVTPLQPMNWVTDAQYVVVPKGVTPDVLYVILKLIESMLTPQQQAIAYDKGYFYPGPAVKGVTLDMAPADSQAAIKQYGRPEYAQWIDQYPKHPSLPADKQVTAFDLWDKNVGKK